MPAVVAWIAAVACALPGNVRSDGGRVAGRRIVSLMSRAENERNGRSRATGVPTLTQPEVALSDTRPGCGFVTGAVLIQPGRLLNPETVLYCCTGPEPVAPEPQAKRKPDPPARSLRKSEKAALIPWFSTPAASK